MERHTIAELSSWQERRLLYSYKRNAMAVTEGRVKDTGKRGGAFAIIRRGWDCLLVRRLSSVTEAIKPFLPLCL